MRFFLLLPALLGAATCAQAAAPPAKPRLDVRGEPLPEGAVARFGAARLRFGYPRRIAFSPDGKTLALGTDAGIRLWDLKSGKVLATPHLEGPGDRFLAFAA